MLAALLARPNHCTASTGLQASNTAVQVLMHNTPNQEQLRDSTVQVVVKAILLSGRQLCTANHIRLSVIIACACSKHKTSLDDDGMVNSISDLSAHALVTYSEGNRPNKRH